MTRDLEEDLAICEAAQPGPWTTHNGDIKAPNGYTMYIGYAADRRDSAFVAAARTGWPETIRYAMKLEDEVDRLRNELNILQEQLEQRG